MADQNIVIQTWRTIDIEPISDLIAVVELMDEFGISEPDNYVLLDLAKSAMLNRHPWTGEPIEPPIVSGDAALRDACRRLLAKWDAFGADEGSGNPLDHMDGREFEAIREALGDVALGADPA